MVHHHADEAADHDRRIDVYEHSVALSLTNVAAQKLINVPHDLIEEHLRELVLLECRIEQQSLKLRILFVMLQCAECERLEDGAIVFAVHRYCSRLRWIKPTTGAGFVIENGGVELLLGGEVTKHHRLGDSGCGGNLFCSSAAKTFL